MNKLTAEKCREQIDNLNAEWEGDGLTDEESLYLQALEIALPILEHQERDEGEWIEWNGECPPLNPDQVVEIKTVGDGSGSGPAGLVPWSIVIAYRIVPERATNQSGE